MMMYVLLLAGFVLLIKGADWFVEGSSDVARFFRVPSVVIGLTIVAMGTSAPEAAVSITAGLAGNNDIAVGNVVGSNIFNLLVVVGVCAILRGFRPDPAIIKRDYPVSILAAVLLLAMMWDGRLSRPEGLCLIILMTGYLALTVGEAVKNRAEAAVEGGRVNLGKSLLFVTAGIAAVVFGGDMVVDNASLIAEKLGMSQNLIGLTIVAAGTSLPELVTSIVAARKGDSGLALGNVIGSNIFNILFILGASSGLHRIVISVESAVDVLVLIVFSTVMYLWSRKKDFVDRRMGIASIAFYLAYMVYIVLR